MDQSHLIWDLVLYTLKTFDNLIKKYNSSVSIITTAGLIALTCSHNYNSFIKCAFRCINIDSNNKNISYSAYDTNMQNWANRHKLPVFYDDSQRLNYYITHHMSWSYAVNYLLKPVFKNYDYIYLAFERKDNNVKLCDLSDNYKTIKIKSHSSIYSESLPKFCDTLIWEYNTIIIKENEKLDYKNLVLDSCELVFGHKFIFSNTMQSYNGPVNDKMVFPSSLIKLKINRGLLDEKCNIDISYLTKLKTLKINTTRVTINNIPQQIKKLNIIATKELFECIPINIVKLIINYLHRSISMLPTLCFANMINLTELTIFSDNINNFMISELYNVQKLTLIKYGLKMPIDCYFGNVMRIKTCGIYLTNFEDTYNMYTKNDNINIYYKKKIKSG